MFRINNDRGRRFVPARRDFDPAGALIIYHQARKINFGARLRPGDRRQEIRVTKPGGVILFAFISVFGIMYANYFQGNWAAGQEENFDADYMVRHFKEQLFTGYDVPEFEQLFESKPVEWITTAGTDGMVEFIEDRKDFRIPDEDF